MLTTKPLTRSTVSFNLAASATKRNIMGLVKKLLDEPAGLKITFVCPNEACEAEIETMSKTRSLIGPLTARRTGFL